MFKKALFGLMVMLTLPNLASAYNYWSISATTSPVVPGAVTAPVAAGYTTSGTTTNVTSAAITSADFTVAAAPAGYTLAYVVIDGVKTAPVAANTYRVNKGTKIYHTLSAVYSTQKYTVTTSRTGNGYIDPTSTVVAGSSKTIKVTPGPGYKIGSVSAGDATLTDGDGVAYGAYTFTNIQANKTISANFVAVPVVDAKITTPAQTITGGTSLVIDGSASTSSVTPTYTWSVTPAATLTPAADGKTATLSATAAGTYTVKLVVTATDATPDEATVAITVVSQASFESSQCTACHSDRNPAIVAAYNGSVHANSAVSCQSCHTTAPHTTGIPDATVCAGCHNEDVTAAYANPAKDCASCHSSNSVHGIKPTTETSCIACHDVAIPKHAGMVDDNNGVRAITTEFTKYSHHVTGVNLQDAHCAACHLEGKVEGGVVVVDGNKHMTDATTHLRNADTDADMVWDPMNPDHALMDNFCMSCHDDNGATSPVSAQIQGVIIPAEGKTASATNPFGDTISNKYDKLQRPAVVDVKGQFDLANPSHHAVMGSRYTGRTSAAGPRQIANPAAFNANSSAYLPGVRKTLYEAGKLNSAYATLTAVAGDASLGDDSVLHCGDCHTVGQWKVGSSVDMNGNPTTVAIGAHGSENAYMLRNTAGTDAKHVGHTLDATGAVNNFGAPWLVCYNCHAFQAYGSPGANAVTHAGEYNVANFRCNSPQYTYTNYTTGTILTVAGVPMNQTRLGYKLGAAGPGSGSSATGGNIYGIQCSNCHNSGPQNGFGGIHGSKVKTYKDGTGAAQKAYRFMPGLGNTMYNPGSMGALNNGTASKGSVDDKNWEQKALTTANREGCYTLAGTTAGNAPARVGAGNLVNGAEVFGTWGACTDHTGTSVQGGVGVTRKVVRPTSY